MIIKIDDADASDATDIAILLGEMDEFYGDTPQGTPAERAAAVSDMLKQGQRATLARADGDLAGIACWSLLWPAAGLTASLYLKELYVARVYQRLGVGAMLMSALHGIAAERGLSRVEWTTDTGNAGAQRFYESLGHEPLASKIFYRSAL